MSVANLFNLDLKDPASVLRFSFSNQAEHFKIQRAIFEKFNVNLPIFPIDPIPATGFVTWAQVHQSMHSSANGILGLQSDDLTTLDPNKPEDVEVWAYTHAQEHYRFAQSLGLT